MKQINVLAIAPYPELSNIFRKAADSFPQIRAEIYVGNLQNASSFLQSKTTGSYNAIISRGGTAQLLRNATTLPVFDIEISAFDMLRTIRLAQQYGRRIAIVGFPSITSMAAPICDIMQYKIEIHTVKNVKEVHPLLDQLTEQGIDLIVGDVLTAETASKIGLNSMLITSGLESVQKAFLDTLHLCQHLEEQQKNNFLFQAISDQNPRGVLVFSEEKELVYSNPAVSHFDLMMLRNLLLKYLDTAFENNTLHITKKIQKTTFDIYGARCQIHGSSYVLFYVDFINKPAMPTSFLSVENFDDLQKRWHFLFNNKQYLQPIGEKLEKISISSLPILIYGNPGTGKQYIARYIHTQSACKASPFVSVNCDILTQKSWDSMMENISSPIHSTDCTIFFHNIHNLSMPLQTALAQYINDTRMPQRCRIIASANCSLADLVASGKFSHSLYFKVDDFSLQIPSLEERLEDLPILSSICINQYNLTFSKQVIGFETEALDYLKSLKWALNYEQLQKVIKQLVATTENHYITREEASNAFATLSPKDLPAQPFSIDLTKTLDEIERSIINYVLAEEHMNQSAAAKRLGVGRSTLWRKIK